MASQRLIDSVLSGVSLNKTKKVFVTKSHVGYLAYIATERDGWLDDLFDCAGFVFSSEEEAAMYVIEILAIVAVDARGNAIANLRKFA